MRNEPYGLHWNGIKGFRVIQGKDIYNHHFGGQECDLPVCKLCGEQMHQIFNFDLKDERFTELRVDNLTTFPLISCLNCSMVWNPQYFKISNEGKTIRVLSQENTEDWIEDEEYKLPIPLPRTNVKLIDMKDDDRPTDEESYETAFDLFGTEYLCRFLGPPLYDETPDDLECPNCNKEMKYIATITQDLEARELISVVDFQFGEMNLYYYLCKDCLIIKTDVQGT